MKLPRLPKLSLTSEQEILANRLVMGGASAALSQSIVGPGLISTAFYVYLSANIVLLLLQLRDRLTLDHRVLIGISLDFSMVFCVMKLDPANMAMFYPLMLWVIMGNGFRFGLKYLVVASICAMAAFSGVFFTTDYWAENSVLGYGLLTALIVIPAYCSTLIRKLSRAKEEAEVANEAKSFFLASVSHELRTPLNAIIGYGNHLKETRLVPSQKQMVEASVLAGEHLLHLFEQLIQVSHTKDAAIISKNTDFSPAQLLSDVRDIMEMRASEKGLYLRMHAEVMSDEILRGPAETIRNILMNLISNALKFTESGGVSVTLRVVESPSGNRIDFEVADTGIGIAPEAQKHIFEAFQQADNTVSSRFGGTGLGLAICRQLIDSISGRIDVTSQIGEGSCFHVSVPMEPARDAADRQTDEPTPTPKTSIVAFGEFTGSILADANIAGNYDLHQVRCGTADDLHGALNQTKLGSFDVALVDQRLVSHTRPDDAIWDEFAASKIAPVLVRHDDTIDIEDIALRAAFASVVPASADFAELRSAIRIGCSFSRGIDENDDTVSHEDKMPSAITATPRSILVADDNRTNRNILNTILEAAGHSVTMVSDGDEVIDALEGGGFDIVLLDVNMPRMNGIEACKMWRQIEGGRRSVPIIGVTADATEQTHQDCLNAGMDARITKPINAKDLLAIIDERCPGDEGTSKEITIKDPLSKVVSMINQGNGPMVKTCPSIDGDQITYLLSIGDAEFLTSMVECYFEDAAENLPKFLDAINTGDVEQFRYCAHAFKSSAKNVGAKKLAELCGALEFITQHEFTRDAQQHACAVQNELKAVDEALSLILAEHTAEQAAG